MLLCGLLLVCNGHCYGGQDNAGKYSCVVDDDCTLSCAQGAVNTKWYKQFGGVKKDCLDGCAADGFDSKCENHICEAYLEGKKHPACTKK